MLTPFQEIKLDRAFSLFDADSDGLIERRDIDLIIDNVAKAAGTDVGSSAYAKIQTGYGKLWMIIAAFDADNDGYVTRNEWRTAMDTVLDSESTYAEIIWGFADQLFALFDTDGNGVVSELEYTLWLTSHHITRNAAIGAFRTLDTNSDGNIDANEMRAIVQEFFYGDDPDAPGNWLFGDPTQ